MKICYHIGMKIFKCTKCGSTRMILKHSMEEEPRKSGFDIVFMIVASIFTLGLYMLFYAFAEKKKAAMGTDYFECENCGYKVGAGKVDLTELHIEEKKEVLDEEEQKAIREVGQNPIVDIKTWKEDRQKAVAERREKAEKGEAEEQNAQEESVSPSKAGKEEDSGEEK